MHYSPMLINQSSRGNFNKNYCPQKPASCFQTLRGKGAEVWIKKKKKCLEAPEDCAGGLLQHRRQGTFMVLKWSPERLVWTPPLILRLQWTMPSGFLLKPMFYKPQSIPWSNSSTIREAGSKAKPRFPLQVQSNHGAWLGYFKVLCVQVQSVIWQMTFIFLPI